MNILAAIAWIHVLTMKPYEPVHVHANLAVNDPTTLVASGRSESHLDCHLLGLKNEIVAVGVHHKNESECVIKITAAAPGEYTWVVINTGEHPESVSLEVK